ncbi:MAG: aminodeoxychorismate synthase component I [Gammaproteobacteria bacterium]|nr:aminodeoxychorismate synthase component I [Gammaproteobacteria bacterium]
MSLPVFHEFPYRVDSTEVFEVLAQRSWASFLDSGHPSGRQGRFDILTADPKTVLLTLGQTTEICEAGETRFSREDPFSLLRKMMGPQIPHSGELPFHGGAIGYFGYDLVRRLERLPAIAKDGEDLPEMAVGIYDWALVVDHHLQRSWVVGWNSHRVSACRKLLLDAPDRGRGPGNGTAYRVTGTINSNMRHGDYLKSVRRIKRYIEDGDCYQVNFSQRFSVTADGDPWYAYRKLRELNSAPFSAYLSTPACKVMSTSPERFLKVSDDRVETRPIKGTAPRGKNALEDRGLAEALMNSGKDRAENLMIVDLLRNDLGKVCAFGSIEVPEMFNLESYARVHHLVSTVKGKLAQGQDAISLLRACFPGGSITGVPKVRAMEIVEELEPHRRGVYCGAIGYIDFNGNTDTNIAIRTMVHSSGMTRLWAGGGIVADSDPEAEYQETFHKAAALLALLQEGEPTAIQ